jgi:tRNA(fMet)-specific endonuclease VapC
MKFMLDINICIYLIKKKSSNILKHIKRYSVGDIGISSITLAELQYGVAKSRHIDKNRRALNEFLLPLEIALFDEKAAEAYGFIRASLENAGTLIGQWIY